MLEIAPLLMKVAKRPIALLIQQPNALHLQQLSTLIVKSRRLCDRLSLCPDRCPRTIRGPFDVVTYPIFSPFRKGYRVE